MNKENSNKPNRMKRQSDLSKYLPPGCWKTFSPTKDEWVNFKEEAYWWLTGLQTSKLEEPNLVVLKSLWFMDENESSKQQDLFDLLSVLS